MPVITTIRYTRREIQAHPDRLYVFGDNLERWGYGGQAREARGEPNAIGIATKRSPYVFLTDADLDEWEAAEAKHWETLFDAVDDGKTIVWPLDGIGTGLAKLAREAPKISAAIAIRLNELKQRRQE